MAQSLFLEKDSPVEFLYLDRQRIASLAGQLSDHGMLVGLKSVAQKTQSKEGNAEGNLGVAKAGTKLAGTFSESSEETYDPFWAHAYSFLQDLEANFAVPLDVARMGSLVKFHGLVQFLDLKMMRNLWSQHSGHFFLRPRVPDSPHLPPLGRRDGNNSDPNRKCQTL
jgi:hypothetical protein